MGNCCRRQSSTPVVSGSGRRALPPKNHRQRRHGASSSCSSMKKGSKEGNLRELKIRMTKKELKELVGWLNLADSNFEQVMARLVNVTSDRNGDNGEEDDKNVGQMVKLRQQRSWRPSLQSIPEII